MLFVKKRMKLETINKLTDHYHSNEFLVVNVALWVLLVNQQLFNFIVCQFLAQRGEQMSKLGRWDKTAGIFVEVA